MSNSTNTALYERAQEAMEELTSHPSGIDKAIQKAIDSHDLEELALLVGRAEGILSEEHFHSMGAFDVF